MGFRFFIAMFLAFCLGTGGVGAQMKVKPDSDYLSISGKKKKDKKPAANKENSEPKDKKSGSSKAKSKSKSAPTTELRAGLSFFTGIPLSDFNKNVYTGFGFNADGEYFLDPQLSVGLNTGFQSFKFDEIHIGQGHFTSIPIQLKGVYYFKEGDLHPFAGLNAGINLTRSKYYSIIEPKSYLDPVSQLFIHTPGGVKSINNTETAFGLAPVAGVVYTPAEGWWINCNIRYNIIFTKDPKTSFIGFNFGVMYTFGI